MTLFYLAVTALVVVTLVVLLRPWRRPTPALAENPDVTATYNAAIHRDRLAELERDHANGTLSAAALTEARAELQRQLLDDTDNPVPTRPQEPVATRPSRKATMGLVILLPLAATALYTLIGHPVALLSPEEADRRARQEMEARVEQLAKKMAHTPDPEGLAMLARSYKSMQRWDDAVKAFERIGSDLNNNPALLAEFAEALAQQQQGFDGRPRELIHKALGINPATPLALFLAGTDAVEKRRYQEAVGFWSQLLQQLEPDSEDARFVSNAIATAKARAGSTAIAKGKSVSGRVELAPELKAKVDPNDTVFIFARAINGPRMPLAALRATVADLPIDFSLDDSMAMNPNLTVSSVNELQVEARVTKSGKAMPEKGDLTGKSISLKPGAKSVRVLIDSVTQ